MDVDVIHTYSSQPEIVNESHVGLEDLNPQVALVDDSSLVRTNIDLGNLQGYLKNSNSSVTIDDIIHIYNLELFIDLPLVHPNLIDWSQHY